MSRFQEPTSTSSKKKKKPVVPKVPKTKPIDTSVDWSSYLPTEEKAKKIISKVSKTPKVPKAHRTQAELTALAPTTKKGEAKKAKLLVANEKRLEALNEARAFRGKKKPETKAEKRASAKGAVVRDILYGGKPGFKKDADSQEYDALRDVNTDSLRQAQVDSLIDQRKDIKKKLAAGGKENKDLFGKGHHTKEVALKSQYGQLNYEIFRLKKDQVKSSIQTGEKSLDKLRNLKNKKNIPQPTKEVIKKEIKSQKDFLDDAKKKNKRITPKVQQARTGAKGTRFAQKKTVSNVLEGKVYRDQGDITDPVYLEEGGIRTRTKNNVTEIKIPGTPGWTKYEIAKNSSAFEDAINTAAIFTPLRAVGTLGRLGKAAAGGTSIAVPALRASRAVSGALKAEGVPTALGLRMAAQGASKGFKGSRAMRGMAGRTAALGVSGAVRGSWRGATRRAGQSTAQKSGIAAKETIKTRSGQAIVRKADDVPKTTKADNIVKGIDDAITGMARIATSPTKFGRFAAPKIAGAGVGGVGLAGILDITDDEKDLEDAAKTIYRDSHDLIVGALPSTYESLAAVGEGLRGIIPGAEDSSWSRANDIIDILKESDPIFLAVQGRWDEALDAAKERPVSTLLELAGAEYVLGRAAGAGLRRVPGVPSKFREYASIPRVTQLGPGDTYAKMQGRYSPDLIRNRIQKAWDKHQSQASKDTRVTRETDKRVDQEAASHRNKTSEMYHDTFAEAADYYKAAEKVSKDHRGANALPWIVSREARTPYTAKKDLEKIKDRLVERQGKVNISDTESMLMFEQRAKTIENLDEILADSEFLSDGRLWDIADAYRDNNIIRQEQLVNNSNLTQGQVNAARWIPYMVEHMGAKYVDGKWKIDSSNKVLDLSKADDLNFVRKHAEKDGVTEPGFFSLSSPIDSTIPGGAKIRGNAKNFHKRTDSMIREGTFDSTFQTLVSHMMRASNTINDSNYLINTTNLFSPRRREDGEVLLDTWQKQFDYIVQTFKGAENRKQMAIVNMEVLKSKLAAMNHLGEEPGVEGGNPNLSEGGSILKTLEAAIVQKKPGNDGDSSYAVIPHAVLNRMVEHANVEKGLTNSDFDRWAARITREFKGGVLPFNPRWQLGNISDMTTRLLMDQTGPLSWNRGRRLIKALEKNPETRWMAEEIMNRAGSGFFSEAWMRSFEDLTLSPTMKVRRGQIKDGEQFYVETLRSVLLNPREGTALTQRSILFARGMGSYSLRMYRGTQEGGFGVARVTERQYRKAALGKEAMRTINNIEGKWEQNILMTPKVLRDVITRMDDSNAISAMANNINSILGDYTRLSPTLRKLVMSYTPFALWYRASTTWVLTLPAKHPAKVALLAAVNRATEEDRAALGFSMLNPLKTNATNPDSITKDAFLQGSLLLGGDMYPTKTLSSFGTFYDPNPFTQFSDFVMPQVSSLIMNGRGLAWTGEKLQWPDGSFVTGPGEITGIAISGLIETYAPATKIWKTIATDNAPDETATIFNAWKPKDEKGIGRLDITHNRYGYRYEDKGNSALGGVLSPIRSYPLDFEGTDRELGLGPKSVPGQLAIAEDIYSERDSDPSTSVGWGDKKSVKKKPTKGWGD